MFQNSKKKKKNWSLAFLVNYNIIWVSSVAKNNYSNTTFLTVHLEDVSLIEFFIAICIAGVIAHVSCGNLSNIQGSIISKVL